MPKKKTRRPSGSEDTEHRVTEKPRDRTTENASDGASKLQRKRASEGTYVTDELPPLATRVTSVQEAVQISLSKGCSEDWLFIFARALKAMELTTGRKLSRTDRQCAFATWWNTARPQLPTDTDFEECQFLFEDAFDRAKHPLGANVLEEAVRRATTQPAPPPEAARYHSAKLQRLVSICRHLQDLAGDSPFFISVRDVARLTDTVSLQHASSLVNGLVRDGILTVVTKGSSSRRSATRFRFNSLAGQRPTT